MPALGIIDPEKTLRRKIFRIRGARLTARRPFAVRKWPIKALFETSVWQTQRLQQHFLTDKLKQQP